MQEVLIDQCLVSAKMYMSKLQVPLQADLPDILIPRLVEDMPFHGGEELTTGMMHAFIPVAMKTLLKVCLGCQCAVL